MIPITPYIAIDEEELQESFLRAGGPGGQNVNKVETAVQLRFDVANSPTLPDWLKLRVRAVAGRKLTADGVLVLVAQAPGDCRHPHGAGMSLSRPLAGKRPFSVCRSTRAGSSGG